MYIFKIIGRFLDSIFSDPWQKQLSEPRYAIIVYNCNDEAKKNITYIIRALINDGNIPVQDEVLFAPNLNNLRFKIRNISVIKNITTFHVYPL